MTTKSEDSTSTDNQSSYKGSFRDTINRRFKGFRAPSFTGYGSRPSSKDIGKSANKSCENLINTNKMTSDTSTELEMPPLTPLTLTGYKSSTKNRLLSNELAEDIRNLIASRLQLYSEWKLLYSLEQHGASLNTLYTRTSPDFEKTSNNIHSLNQSYNYSTTYNTYSNNHQKKLGYILVVKDSKGNIFGAFSNEYFHPSDNRRFYGNGECFLWKCKNNNCFTINKSKDSNKIQRTLSRSNTDASETKAFSNSPPNDEEVIEESDQHTNQQEHHGCDAANPSYEQHLQFFAYPYTGLNDFIIYSTKNFLSLGVGDGHYGLWIDSDLINGVSYRTLTFGNEPLSDAGTKFKINNVELWKVGG